MSYIRILAAVFLFVVHEYPVLYLENAVLKFVMISACSLLLLYPVFKYRARLRYHIVKYGGLVIFGELMVVVFFPHSKTDLSIEAIVDYSLLLKLETKRKISARLKKDFEEIFQRIECLEERGKKLQVEITDTSCPGILEEEKERTIGALQKQIKILTEALDRFQERIDEVSAEFQVLELQCEVMEKEREIQMFLQETSLS